MSVDAPAWPPSGWGLTSYDVKGQASFEGGDFDADIQDHGLWTRWERYAACPCRNNGQTEQPDPLCPNCHGSGHLYHSPVLIKVVYYQPTADSNELVVWGDWVGGEAVATPRSEIILGFRDKLTVIDALMVMHESAVTAPGPNELLRFRYPIASRQVTFSKPNLDPCAIEEADSCSGVQAVDRSKLTVEQRVMHLLYELPDHELVWLEEGADFTVTQAGQVDLSPAAVRGTAPRAGTLMTAAYLAHPAWIVMQWAPYAVQFQYQTEKVADPVLIELPKTFKCQLDFFGDTNPRSRQAARELGG